MAILLYQGIFFFEFGFGVEAAKRFVEIPDAQATLFIVVASNGGIKPTYHISSWTLLSSILSYFLATRKNAGWSVYCSLNSLGKPGEHHIGIVRYCDNVLLMSEVQRNRLSVYSVRLAPNEY
jgi:hypothetical protein